jgi:hypothetical protein
MRQARLPSFFRTPRHRRFELKTRYYDERKEAMQRRLAERGDAGAAAGRLREAFRSKRAEAGAVQKASNLRLALILLALLALGYWVFY